MKGSMFVTQVVFLLHLFCVIAGNDVTTFNQDELDDDNIDVVLETEHFIQVVHRPNSRRSHNVDHKSQYLSQSTMSPNPSVQEFLMRPIQNGGKMPFQDLNTSVQLDAENFAYFDDRTINYSKPRSANGKWARSSYWEDLSFTEDERENDPFILDGEEVDKSLSRNKRQSTVGSGSTFTKTRFTLTDAATRGKRDIPQKTDIEYATEKFLQGYFQRFQQYQGAQVEVTVTSYTFPQVNADIIYPEYIPIIEIARALNDLQTNTNNIFKLGSKSYRVSLIHLQDPSNPSEIKGVICFFCGEYEKCQLTSLTQIWKCILRDERLYPFGSDENDITLPANDEFYTERIILPYPITYDRQLVKNIFVSVNGLVSFNDKFSSYTPVPCPSYIYGRKRMMIAPFWADLELTSFDKARVLVNVYIRRAGMTLKDRRILDRATQDVLLYSGERSFVANTVVKITWSDMPPWPVRFLDNERVTFQCIIISNGEATYVFYLYAQGAMRFNPILRRNVVICAKDFNLDLSRINYYRFDTVIGNTGNYGHWFFLLGRVPNSRAKCFEWFESNVPFLRALSFWNQFIIPRCPCSEFNVMFSFRWIPSTYQAGCYDIFPSFGQIGRRCCYRRDRSFSFENRIPVAGSLQLFTPYYGDLRNHEIQDAAPKRWCCYESDLCYLYYLARPVETCIFRATWRGMSFGEPHIKTIDGQTFIFNGLGEYRLLEINAQTQDNKTVDFKLQGRTCQARNVNGSLSRATVFCAIVMGNTNKTVQVEIHSSGKYMVIYVNGQDFTARFRDIPSFNASTGGFYIKRMNESLSVATPDDIGITVSLVNNLLDFTVEIDVKYRNMTTALMGNFNGIPEDDYIFPNGTALPNTTSDRQLFEYGKAWTVNESIFTYLPAENSSTFSDPNFSPIFLDEINETLLEEAKKICGGESNLPCIFDYSVTRNEQLATSTKDTISSFNKEETKFSNRPPIINGTMQMNVTVNEISTLTITGSDPDNDKFSYVLVSRPSSGFNYTNSSSTFIANYIPTDLNPVSIGVAAEDEKGLQSEIVEVTLVTCSACNNHGSCNFTELRNTSTPYFSLASCDCESPYSGDDCEYDKDGCANSPCAEGTNCTDVPAPEEAITGIAYNCSDCPKGFYLNGTKCEDTDECESGNACGDHANCTNIYGSYICECNHGYRKTISGECIDINECVENQHKCNQICNNTDGSYDCACHEGFTLALINRFTCRKSNIDPCQNLTNNNCSYGCINVSGIAKCFCEFGMRLAADGSSCEDIDECQENLCSQKCNNTDGSYECSCFSGYYLMEDRLTCELCADNQYGSECMSTCNCRGRAERCDNVKGCICSKNWAGPSCEEDVDECEILVDPCPKEQICINTNGSFICACPEGYEETYSNRSCYNINECDFPEIHNCSQGCADNPGSFTCTCNDGYDLVNNTCKDINECELGISGCEQRCVNMEGSFNCLCHLGFVLTDDRKACIKDMEPCRDFNISCDYACDIVDGLPDCYCPVGYRRGTDNKTCIEINECTEGLHKCTDKCLNTPGSYNCSCSDGSRLLNDKRSCKKCDNYHWGPNCGNTCACNTKGSVKCDPVNGCECQPGWGGTTCSDDKDECSQNQTVCSATSRCVNTIGSYLCQCADGFKLDKNVCSDIDECDSSPCDHNCTNTLGSYVCFCSVGFLSDGDKCIDYNECAIPSLSNCDQRCRNTEGGFACECFEGYILNTTTRNTCYRDPQAQTCGVAAKCNDSICIVQNGQEICTCRPGYELTADSYTCKNIDECLRNPCVSSNCTDLNGTFECACGSGLKLGTDGVTCQACDHWSFGENCTNTCTCNITNTKKCRATDGTCECISGWNGTTCSEDIDECYDSSKNICGAYAHCENSPGSFKCVCDAGFFRTSTGECISCDATHYGQDCLSSCICVTANTVDCDDVTGNCTCKSGWEGSTCDTDIDECNNSSYCSDVHDSCLNLDGSFECRCKSGYDRPNIGDICQDINECLNPVITTCTDLQNCNNRDGDFQCICKTGYQNVSDNCIACDATHYGQDCLSSCICVTANTLDCDDVTGECTCKSGWEGPICDTDIDECKDPSYCPDVLDSCLNLDGSFECRCNSGYERPNIGDVCQANFKMYQVNISMAYTASEIGSFGSIFDSSTEDFRRFVAVVEISLFNYGKRILPFVFLGVKIINLYPGSIVADTAIYIDEKNSTNPPADAAKIIYLIHRDKELNINDTTVKVNITFGNETLTSSDTVCDIFNKLGGQCKSNETCEVDGDNNSAKCAPQGLSEAQSKTNLTIGLAVGIPLFIILIIAVALLACLYVRRKRKNEQQSSSQSVDHAAPFRNVFATRTSTKGSWGAPHQLYAPDVFSDAGTNESGNGSLTRTRQKGRSDFQDSAWYDNRGATSSGVPDSRETSTEAVGPTSNFSWEYMFRLLEPHRDFEIQRPYYEPRPNPTFIPRNKKPDSAA